MTTVKEDIKALGVHIEQIMEMAAAQIIKEISDKMDKCECMEKLLDKPNNQIVLGKGKEKISEKSSGLQKYSYPNHMVGNE